MPEMGEGLITLSRLKGSIAISQKQLGVDLGFPLILGVFLCLFKHLQQDRIHGGLNLENTAMPASYGLL